VVEDRLHLVFKQISDIWVSNQVKEPQMYSTIFTSILVLYLGILVPLQVIGSTNEYWALLIIPIIIMIYVSPLIVSNWIGHPFKKNKMRNHPPHRQHRAGLCEKIARMFGDNKRVIHASLH